MLLKASMEPNRSAPLAGFSTLYRVDAIEGAQAADAPFQRLEFQYPLSGRCY